MAGYRPILIAIYALISITALVATWSQNLAYFGPSAPAGGALGPFGGFVADTAANPASRSITLDIGLFLMAAAVFMVIEARRLSVRFVSAYIVLGFLVAISVTFPLFMIARELRLAKAPDAPPLPSLTGVDWLTLILTGAVVAVVSARVLGVL
jgi:hypothetical protein